MRSGSGRKIETLKRGHEEIETAQKIGAKTERERGYISALGDFYSDPSKANYLKQAGAYSDAMAKLYQKYPDDLEAGAFYALSLMAAEKPDDASHEATKKAVAVLNPLFQKQPDHPGLAHYIIHACDSPDMARWDWRRRGGMRRSRPRRRMRCTCRRTSLPGWDCGRKTFRRT